MIESKYNIPHPKFTVELGNFDIPIYVHIKDITINYDRKFENGIIGNPYLDKYGYMYDHLEKINNLKKYFKFINTEDRIFYERGKYKNFLEYNNLNHVDELLDCLSLRQINILAIEIQKAVSWTIDKFIKELYLSLNLEEEIPPSGVYNDPDKMPEDLSNFLKYSLDYIEGQIGIEFTAYPIFSENFGKAMSDWSFREWEYRKAYITAKNKKESASEGYKANKMEETRRENKR